MPLGRRKRMKPEQIKLAAYLGARHLHRFKAGRRVSPRAHDMRIRLVLVAIGLGIILLFGLWQEFHGGG